MSTRQKFLRKQTKSVQRGEQTMRAKNSVSDAVLFDHLVGTGEQRWRQGNGQRLRSFSVD